MRSGTLNDAARHETSLPLPTRIGGVNALLEEANETCDVDVDVDDVVRGVRVDQRMWTPVPDTTPERYMGAHH